MSHMLPADLYLRPLPFLDGKWLRADLIGSLRHHDDAAILWNNLIQDCELVSSPAAPILNSAGNLSYLGDDGKHYCGMQRLQCSCCQNDYCGPLSACNCPPCHTLDSDSAIKKMTTCSQNSSSRRVSSDVIFESWLWGHAPSTAAKQHCQRTLIGELHDIALQAGGNCLSAIHLRQQLLIYERYFVALARYRQQLERQQQQQQKAAEAMEAGGSGLGAGDKFKEDGQQAKKERFMMGLYEGLGGVSAVKSALRHQASSQAVDTPAESVSSPLGKDFERATIGLARVGTRAALNFTFAFLRRAWRSGEDTEMCSELLSEALESLQDLPEASLFDASQVSQLWIEVLERSMKFLRQVALGDPMGGRCIAPRKDRHVSLCLLLELATQKGTLTAALEAILLLITLWEKEKDLDNDNRAMGHRQNRGAPLVPILRRYAAIGKLHSSSSSSPPSASVAATELEATASSATESFLRFLTLPEQESANVDLKQAAVVIISHLDRLAKPHMMPGGGGGSGGCNMLGGLGSPAQPKEPKNRKVAVKMVPPSPISSLQAQVSQDASVGGATSLESPTGVGPGAASLHEQRIYSLGWQNFGGMQYGFTAEPSVGLQGGGPGGGGAGGGTEGCLGAGSYQVPVLNFYFQVKQVAISEEYVLFLTHDGKMYQWRCGRPETEPMLIEEMADTVVAQIAAHCEGKHYMALDVCGNAYSWGSRDGAYLGHGDTMPRDTPTKIQKLDRNCKSVHCGAESSAAITFDGALYTWGVGSAILGHGNNENKLLPCRVSALQDYKVVDVALGGYGNSHSLCLTVGGLVFGWGCGAFGMLGDSSNNIVELPVLIEALPRSVMRVFTGPWISLALTSDGRLYTWGRSDDGRLGHGGLEASLIKSITPKPILAFQSKVIVNVSVGSYHCLALTSGGEVYGWGRNDYQQICPGSVCKEAMIPEPILASPPSVYVSGIACGSRQSVIWSQTSVLEVPPAKLPFVIELSEQTFRLLDQLLEIVCGQDVDGRKPPNQESECIAVACLNLLRLQMHSLLANGVSPKAVGLYEGSRLLVSLKTRILRLAGGSSVLKTMQEAAQWTLQVGWSLLMPTAAERAQTLTSLLPAESSYSSSGHRFMTDLLVRSLMAEGGLETALFHTIRSNTRVDSSMDGGQTLPLLHLIKQLLRNNSTLTHARLTEIAALKKNGPGHLKSDEDDAMPSSGGGPSWSPHASGQSLSPCLELLHRFQRLLFAHVHQATKNEDLSGAETLFAKYFQIAASFSILSLQKAHEIGLKINDCGQLADIMKNDISDTLLFEMIIGLIILKRDRPTILDGFRWTKVFVPLLHALDNFNRIICDSDVQDSDDMGWPGIICRGSRKQRMSSTDESTNVVYEHDVENHIIEGGKWIILNGYVCDVSNYQCNSNALNEIIENGIGKDITAKLNRPIFRRDADCILANLKVGRYAVNDEESKGYPQYTKVVTHLGTERALAYLLGLVCNILQSGPPLQPAELQCKSILKSNILRGGLQLLQPANPFDEEKGEARSSASTAGSTPTDSSAHCLGTAKSGTDSALGLKNIGGTTQQRIDTFIASLSEGRLGEPLVATWIRLVERYCKENNMIWHQNYPSEHPVQELERLLTAVLIRHQSLGGKMISLLQRELSGLDTSKPIREISEMIRLIYQTKWSVIRTRQQLNRSYKEVCAPMLERLRFLLHEVRPAISLEQEGLRKLFILNKLPRFKELVRRIIVDIRTAKKQLACTKPEDIVNVTIQSQHSAQHRTSNQLQEQMQVDLAVSPATNDNTASEQGSNASEVVADSNVTEHERKMTASHEDSCCKRQAINELKFEESKFRNIEEMRKLSERWYFHGELNVALMNEFVEFIMQDVCDVETVRRAMYCQVQRYQLRRHGIEMLNSLVRIQTLLNSVQYNLLNGYLGLYAKTGGISDTSYKLRSTTASIEDDVQSITASQKVSLRLSYSQVLEWCVAELQRLVNQEQVNLKHNKYGTCSGKDNSNLGTYVFLKKLPRARFLLSLFGILAKDMDSNELSLIVNSGTLGMVLGLLSQTGGDVPAVKNTYELSVVYEDVILKQKLNKANLSGPELAKLMKIGTRIVRGADWKWGDQDGNPPGEGRIISEVGEDGWVRVEWYTGGTNSYRMGKEGQYDLRLAESALNIISPDTDNEKDEFSGEAQLNGESHPTKLLRYACTKFLQILSVGIGLQSERMDKNAVRSIASMFRSILDPKSALANICGLDNWTTLGFLKAVADESRMLSTFLTSPTWIYFYIDLLEKPIVREQSVFRKIHCLRLLQTVLVYWASDSDAYQQRMNSLVERLFITLGRIVLHCPHDWSLQQHLSENKSRVLLTASHSSTIAEEIVTLLRKLHTLPHWNASINSFMSQKLCVAAELLSVEPFDGSAEPMESETVSVMGVLGTIGGCDLRPRVGLQVCHEGSIATICGFTSKGNCLLSTDSQTLDGEFRKISLSTALECADYSVFSLSRLPLNEMLLNSWSVQIYGPGERKESVPNVCDLNLLRSQQMQLAVLNSNCVLYRHQVALRKILKQRSPAFRIYSSAESTTEEDPEGGEPSMSDADDTQDGEAASSVAGACGGGGSLPHEAAAGHSNNYGPSASENELLIQSILIRATQPSPVKAIYSYNDLAIAALNCTQVLTSEMYTETNKDKESTTSGTGGVTGNRTAPTPMQPTMVHGEAIYNVAVLNESATAAESSEVNPDSGRLSGGKNSELTDSSLITQIIEMGFCRKSVEYALKNLASNSDVAHATPELVVQWLLEHPDVAAKEAHDSDGPTSANLEKGLSDSGPSAAVMHPHGGPLQGLYDSEPDSDNENSDSSSATVEGSSIQDKAANKVRYRTRKDFATNDQYAMYVRSTVTPGMLVRCCKDFEEIKKDDVGTVVVVDTEGLHDLNVQVDWQKHGSTYWVCFVHIEMLEMPRNTIAKGAYVRLRATPPRKKPPANAGQLCGCVGVVTAVSGKEVSVDFPQNPGWKGTVGELECVTDCPAGTGGCGYSNSPSARYRGPQTDLVDDWSRCIRSLAVSSNEALAKNLLDPNLDVYWQSSSNSQSKHWIRLEMHENILVHQLSVMVSPSDHSHMPALIVIRVGDSVATLKDYTWISVKNTDTLVTLLADMHQYFPWIEIVIKQCRNNGIQCKVHALYISGRKRSQTDLDLMLMNASFLAYEYEDQLAMDSNHTPCPSSTTTGGAFSLESKSLLNERPCTVMVWGLNDKEQLGGLKGSKVKVPTFSQTISRLRPIHIAGGSKSLFIVSQDGKVYACGEGTNGRLGLGVSINVSTPRQIPVLHQYVVKKVAVHSGGKHAMALTLDGKVFSWGEGEDGKLGHGNRLTLDKPKMIEALRSKKIRDIACGSSHSAAITSAGELFTWGLGEYGRLGHGDTCTQLKPKLVAALSGKRVIQVACGSRDAQTLALTDDGLVFSWGDGDFGKLGRGGSEGSSLPQEIDRLSNMGVVQIECGAQFSLALTRSGEVWTWGKGDYYRLGHANDQHVRKPVQVQGLRFCKVIHVAVGALHCLAVTDTGMVYAWGDNDHGQQGSGNTVVNKKPALVVGLDSVNVNRVACGSSHSIAWGMPQTTVDEEKIGPVPFATTKDPLGGSSLGIYETETEPGGAGVSGAALGGSAADSQNAKASLSEILLSLETNGARQTALNYVLNAMSILQARQLVIAALTSHSRMFLHGGGKVDSDVVENVYGSAVGGSGGGGAVGGGAVSGSGLQYGPEKVSYGKDTAVESGSMATGHGNDVIEQGGGEGPADDTDPAVHETSPEADYGGPVPSVPAGAYSAFHSLTGSLSLSASVSSAAAQHKQSKMSASAMSVVAATITNEEEIIEDTSVTGLDDFTSLLGETEAKSLVELLKLSVAGRCGPVGTAQTIADTLIALGSNSPSIGAMLLETCITELEDLCTARHSLGKIPKPVIQESPHPYVDNMTTMGHVKIPGAEALRIEFDCQCSTEKRNDPLVIMDGSGRVIAMRSGRDFSQWASEIRIPGDEMRWKFTSDNSVNGWGWRFWVNAIMPTTSVSERGSDRAVLSQPSIALVMALLNERLGGPLNNMSVLLRLAAALAACAHLSSLSTPQRIWALKRLHAVITSKHAPKPQDRLLQPILQPMIPDLLRQYEYEEPQVRSGIHLMHSDYFKTLAALACDMQLDTLLPASEIHKWAWFKRYCIAVRVAQSLIKRSPLPRLFCSEVKNKLTELIPQSLGSGGSLMNSMGSLTSSSSVSSHQMITEAATTSHQAAALSASPFAQTPSTSHVVQYIDPLVAMSVPEGAAGSSTAGSIIVEPPLKSHQLLHEDHEVFKAEHDLQLLQWLNRRPDDWELSWGGASTIYGWGHNHRGQLGGLEGSRIKTPTPCEALSLLRPVQLAGGEQTLFAVTPDGKLFATGYGSGGRLGVGGTDSWAIPTLAGSLQHVFVKKVAVNSGGKHCLALTTDGEVYSWGEGEDGKLGHGNRVSYDRPKLIEDLNGIGIVDIACGSAHSAAITSSGHVLTWGKGRYGRLGHGDSEDQLRPKLVEALLGYRAVDIACGSGDAQTLCITDDDNVWSWGDGDYGKLGRGGSDGCKLPYKIESLAGLGVIKVECGSQFSVALTKSGAVYTWGKGDFHRLGHGSVDHVRRPKKVAALQSKKIISIATGSLHCVACSDTGEVYTWGDNDEGQLGDGTVSAIQRPRLVAALQGKHIVKVTCGSAHTLALSTTTLSDKVRPPPSPPLEYDLVRELPPEALHARLILLHHFSELLCPCLAMLPITGDLSLGALKDVVVYSIKEAAFRKVIQTTMMRDKQHGPVIELNRIQVKRSRCKSGNGLAGVDGMKSVFGQMVQKLPLLTQESLSLPHRVWKVKFVGESVDDCGGGYSESIAEMCDELQNGSVPLLITTPNGRGEAGANRDCFLLDPTLTSVLQMNMFRFLGVLMGIAVRTGSPLSLNLAEPVWRQLAGEQLRPSDLTEVDRDYVAGLLCIRNMDDDPKFVSTLELPFSTSSAKGYEVPLSTRFTRITAQNRHEYVRLALNFRLHEFDEQVKAVRDGMSKVIPVPLLSLFSAAELQAMVCGSPDIPLGLLKSVATYKGFDLNSPQVIWFWEVMEDFTNQERSLFLRFVWGRTRLPRTIADFRGRDFVLQVLEKFPPDHFLPESYTCFFLLKMPRYTCKAVLLEKLKYAIHFCKSIDTDEYARVAMGDPTEATGSEDDSDMESVASRDV